MMGLQEKAQAMALFFGGDPDKAAELLGSAEEFKRDMKEMKALLTEIRDIMRSLQGGK
jgi:hypothetical protein